MLQFAQVQAQTADDNGRNLLRICGRFLLSAPAGRSFTPVRPSFCAVLGTGEELSASGEAEFCGAANERKCASLKRECLVDRRWRFLSCCPISNAIVDVFMSLPSVILALVASLFIVGCANKNDQITPAQAALEKKDQHEWSSEEGRVR